MSIAIAMTISHLAIFRRRTLIAWFFAPPVAAKTSLWDPLRMTIFWEFWRKHPEQVSYSTLGLAPTRLTLLGPGRLGRLLP